MLAGLATALPLAGCFSPAYQARYRLTIDVETPEGLRSGTSVFEQKHGVMMAGTAKAVRTRDVRGEATVVDLGHRGSLIALLMGVRWDRSWINPTRQGWEVERAFMDHFGVKQPWDGHRSPILERLSRERTSPQISLYPQQLPMLVHVADPRTWGIITLVDPGDLTKTCGAGVRLSSARVAITADPISRTLNDRLPWLEAAIPAGDKWVTSDGPLSPEEGNRFEPNQYDLQWFGTRKWWRVRA